jgi:hypothetical protein
VKKLVYFYGSNGQDPSSTLANGSKYGDSESVQPGTISRSQRSPCTNWLIHIFLVSKQTQKATKFPSNWERSSLKSHTLKLHASIVKLG